MGPISDRLRYFLVLSTLCVLHIHKKFFVNYKSDLIIVFFLYLQMNRRISADQENGTKK